MSQASSNQDIVPYKPVPWSWPAIPELKPKLKASAQSPRIDDVRQRELLGAIEGWSKEHGRAALSSAPTQESDRERLKWLKVLRDAEPATYWVIVDGLAKGDLGSHAYLYLKATYDQAALRQAVEASVAKGLKSGAMVLAWGELGKDEAVPVLVQEAKRGRPAAFDALVAVGTPRALDELRRLALDDPESLAWKKIAAFGPAGVNWLADRIATYPTAATKGLLQLSMMVRPRFEGREERLDYPPVVAVDRAVEALASHGVVEEIRNVDLFSLLRWSTQPAKAVDVLYGRGAVGREIAARSLGVIRDDDEIDDRVLRWLDQGVIADELQNTAVRRNEEVTRRLESWIADPARRQDGFALGSSLANRKTWRTRAIRASLEQMDSPDEKIAIDHFRAVDALITRDLVNLPDEQVLRAVAQGYLSQLRRGKHSELAYVAAASLPSRHVLRKYLSDAEFERAIRFASESAWPRAIEHYGPTPPAGG